jgi:hypothetical protein
MQVRKPETDGDNEGAVPGGLTAGRAEAKEDSAMGEGSEVEATGGRASMFESGGAAR